ncbi:MAG: MBL fold metallo-hydrolase [Opitutaceae bacterium]|jgi:L-ascorbate metabolism protein UlaG (beta-lactamase superfamily)|nr:MBL fold metallo-hydrolase [Opitutaceae bacterium]NBR57856.1 MBL fold metallo-hydrolase [Opitutaceae bacterium]
MAPALRFPVSDHSDGRRFFNPSGQRQAAAFSALLKWSYQRLVLRRKINWPKEIPANLGVKIPQQISPGKTAVTFIGHSTFLLQQANLNLLTDPIFSERASPLSWAGPKRVRPPALKLTELPRVQVVLISHNHYDHLDLPTLRWLAREHQPQFITTLGNKAWLNKHGLKNVIELDWWQTHPATAELEVIGTPAQHFSARWPWDRCQTLWGGFALKTAAKSFYFTGDSGYNHTFKEIGARLGPFDLALIPIGAYEPRWFMQPVHCTPEEAVRIHQDVGSRQSWAMHFGTFQLTDEGINDPAVALAAARIAHNLNPTDFTVPNFGETKWVD